MLLWIASIVAFELALVAAAIWWLARPATEPASDSATSIDRPTLIASAVAIAAVILAPMVI